MPALVLILLALTTGVLAAFVARGGAEEWRLHWGSGDGTEALTVRYLHGAADVQFPPSALGRHARMAEAAGFDDVYCGDHSQPWCEGGVERTGDPIVRSRGGRSI